MDLTDESIIESFLKTKERELFKSLVRKYQNRVYSAAFRFLGNAEEAEEVVQDTFVRVHQNLDKFRHQSSFSAWVFKICHNLCMDILRVKQRRSGYQVLNFDSPKGEDRDTALSAINQLPDEVPGPAQILDSKEQGRMISDSLSQLPDYQRTVLILHDVEGFSYQEIAEIVDANIGTVRSRLHYGRLKMKELLDPYFSFSTVSSVSR